MDTNDHNKKIPYIIGETAYNHESDIDYLFRVIDEMADLKINDIKFHLLINLESYMQKNHPLISSLKLDFTEIRREG